MMMRGGGGRAGDLGSRGELTSNSLPPSLKGGGGRMLNR